MAQAEIIQAVGPNAKQGLGATDRSDNWRLGPMLTGLGLGAFVVYSTARAIAGFFVDTYELGLGAGNELFPDNAYLLSPFYSPILTGLIPESLTWISPAVFILWAPGGFRVTCYYYRKAYYRAFFMDPPACAVGEPGSLCGVKRGMDYKGETRLLLFQNLHRYFMYLALMFLVLLAIDVVHACIWPVKNGNGNEFGISVGTLVLAVNVTCLSMYSFSCHSLRHLIGGRINCFSRIAFGQQRYKIWSIVSELNKHHMFWAWISLFMVGFADFYVWMVARGTFTDFRLF